MRLLLKLIFYPVLLCIFLIVGCIFFLWASTIHDSVFEGSKYGFTIGSSKNETFTDVMNLKDDYPDFVIYTYVETDNHYNPKHIKLSHDIDEMVMHDQWRIYFGGDGEYSNSIRLNFEDNKLSNFYRHRQYYEVP